MDMPVPDAAILARKGRIVARLRAVLPADAVIDDAAEVRVYECDALSAYRCPPMAAVLPRTTAEVSAVLRVCWEEGVPVVPRGSGTSLAGGAMPTADCVVLGVSRMTAVLETDYPNRLIRVQAGRTNLSVTGAVEGEGFFYAPDPSSQLACAIAGTLRGFESIPAWAVTALEADPIFQYYGVRGLADGIAAFPRRGGA